MAQQTEVFSDGRVFVNRDGHSFEFQVYIRGEVAMCLVGANWPMDESDPAVLDRARLDAEQAARSFGWLPDDGREVVWQGI